MPEKRSHERATDAFITIAEAAERLGVTDRTIRTLIARGDLPAYRLGTRAVRIREDSLSAVLRPIPAGGIR